MKKMSLALTAAVAFLTLSPHVAQAHAILDTSSPAASSVIGSTPTEISLRFNEHVEGKLASIRLFGADQKEISIGTAQRDPADFSHVSAAVGEKGIELPRGVYVVVWRVVSADGHPANGAFPFEIGEQSSGTGTQLLANVLKDVSAQSPLGTPLALARLLSYLSAVVLLGCIVFSWTLVSLQKKQLVFAQWSTAGLLIGSVVALLFQGPYVAGKSWGALTDFSLLSDISGTRLGLALISRAVFAIVWGVLMLMFSQHQRAWWKNIAFLCAAVTIMSFASSGHASAGTLPALFIAIDALHLLGIAVWIGGLFMLAMSRNSEHDSVARFSRLATWAMPLTVVTGVVQGLHLMGGMSEVTSTAFGKLLMLKTALVVVVVVLGAQARKRLTDLPNSFTRLVRYEVVLVLLILAVTSFMVGKTPTSAQGTASQTFSATQLQGDVLASIEVAPTKVGTMAVHVILSPPGGALSPVKSVAVQFALPAKDVPAIPVTMVSIGPNHWSGVVQIPYSGTWDLEVRVKPTDTETLLYTSQVLVKG